MPERDPGGAGAGGPVLAALVGSILAIYMISQFLRNSVGVLAPELARELALTAEEIGLLSSIFFLAFAAIQIPLGMALDRFGPRACMLVSTALALSGACIFALAQSFVGLAFGRVLMGLGCSSFFMAPLTIYARWFAPQRFATLTSLQLGVGSVGTILATAPLAFAAAAFGWRGSFFAAAGVTALAGLLVLLFVRDAPPASPRPAARGESLAESMAGVGAVFRWPSVWPVFAMHFAGYSTFLAVLGLWGGAYLSDVYGYGIERRGTLLLVLAAANVVGTLSYGPLDRLLGSRKLPVAAGGFLSAILIGVLALRPWPADMLPVLFAALGLSAGFHGVLTAHGASLFPDRLVGRGITLLNTGTMLGVFTLQSTTGLIMGQFAAESGSLPFVAYQACFAFCALVLLSISGLYAFMAEDRPPGAVRGVSARRENFPAGS